MFLILPLKIYFRYSFIGEILFLPHGPNSSVCVLVCKRYYCTLMM
uniref:Uncharacterized protein n=1 Tax=Arundo donax TaxID=35708 RepID=A0A0A8Z823_ARUDO